MNNEPTKYEIKSFEQLCNIANDENIERLATDTALWLIQYQKIISELRSRHPDKYNNKNNWEIAQGYFNWLDDGKNDLIGFHTTVKETGETRFYKYPNKD